MGIIFGLLAALGQAVGYISIKKSYKDLNPSIAFFFDACFGLVIWVPFALLIGVELGHLSHVFWIALLSALLSEAFVFYALSKGHLSISGTIFATYPIFTILFSYLLNNERLLLLHWFFVGLNILGILIISIPKKLTKLNIREKAYVLWPLAAAIVVGLSDTLGKGIIDQTSAQAFLLVLAFVQVPIAIGYLFITKQSLRQFEIALKRFSIYKFAILGSLLNVIVVVFFWLAIENTYASIASPISATYPALLVVLAMIFLHEKPTPRELFGLAMTIVGVVGISFFYY